MKNIIYVKGARENNLKNIDVEIKRGKFTVITGVSGSGKSTLAFDVIYGEGQRRLLDSFSSSTKRFITQLKKPDVDFISGLSPVVAIEQKTSVVNPRSTVGTMTEIFDYLRLLYTNIGIPHCPYCNCEMYKKSTTQIIEHLLSLPHGTKVELSAPINKIFGEEYNYLFDDIRNKGYRKFRINGELLDSSNKILLDEQSDYNIEVVIDRIIVRKDMQKQLVKSIESAMVIGEGFIKFDILESEILSKDSLNYFYNGFACPHHHILMGEVLPKYFSFNEPTSACPTCMGLGLYPKVDPGIAVLNRKKSIRNGALGASLLHINKQSSKYMLYYSLSKRYNFSLDVPFCKLTEDVVDIILYGTKGEKFKLLQPEDLHYSNSNVGKLVSFEGIVNEIERKYKDSRKPGTMRNAVDEQLYKKSMVESTCMDCNGRKYRKQRFLVKVNGKDIYESGEMTLEDVNDFISSVSLSNEKQKVGDQILKEIKSRLNLLLEIGLGYLSLNRRADTISGGELQRIRLVSQICSELVGMIYVIDEPSIGLHAKDTQKVITMIKRLRNIGNTVLVVEHDMETISEADDVIEIGPAAGIYGGNVVVQGSLSDIQSNSNSLTGLYFSGKRKIDLPEFRRSHNGRSIKIYGARENNLKNIEVTIPFELLICITGVSGSGKSTLINDVLYKKLNLVLNNVPVVPGLHDRIEGYEYISNVININQSPIGRHSNSNPATYVGFYDKIRNLFAQVLEAVEGGYTISDFSFNSVGGRCEECKGNGVLLTQLQFMPDVESVCPLCYGLRFNKEVLDIKYKEKSIADVLNMSVEEAMSFFSDSKYILHKLKILNELGLGYIKLGQTSTTLSGGEAQRIKLATELSIIKRGDHNLYILDEPTTGLHLEDIKKLLVCLNRLVDAGNTVIVIEHHLDVIKTADYIIDVGPGAGKYGGKIVAVGTPEEVSMVSESYTGQYLKKML